MVSGTQRESPGRRHVGGNLTEALCVLEGALAAEPAARTPGPGPALLWGGWSVRYWGGVRNPTPDSRPAQAPLQPQSPHICEEGHPASEVTFLWVLGGADNW